MKKLLLIATILLSCIQTGYAMDLPPVPSVTPQEAVKMRQQGMLLIDVRTRPEFEMVGHPRGAANIPYKNLSIMAG